MNSPDIVGIQCDHYARQLGEAQRLEEAAEERFQALLEQALPRAEALEAAWLDQADWDQIDLLLFRNDPLALMQWIREHILPQQEARLRTRAEHEVRKGRPWRG